MDTAVDIETNNWQAYAKLSLRISNFYNGRRKEYFGSFGIAREDKAKGVEETKCWPNVYNVD